MKGVLDPKNGMAWAESGQLNGALGSGNR